MARPHDRPSGLHAAASATGPARAAPPPAAHGPAGFDPLSDVLRTVRLTGALFFLVEASDPWGIEVPAADRYAGIVTPGAQHVVSYHVMLEGSGWVRMPGLEPTRFTAGDVLVFAHADPYQMLSAPDRRPEFDAEATLGFFRDMAAGRLPFVVEEGGGGAPRARYVCGYLGCDLKPFNPVLATLPRFLRVRRPLGGEPDLLDRLIELTLAEMGTRRFGGESIRLRLSELIFVEVLRRHLAALPPGQPGWLSGLRSPTVGRALALIHARPAEAWTLIALAREAATSRAVLAERFAALVGCPPMQYLTLWRMQIAARLLADRAAKVAGPRTRSATNPRRPQPRLQEGDGRRSGRLATRDHAPAGGVS